MTIFLTDITSGRGPNTDKFVRPLWAIPGRSLKPALLVYNDRLYFRSMGRMKFRGYN